MMSRDQCMLCFDNCTPEGGGEEKRGSKNFKNKAHRAFDFINNFTPVYVQIDYSEQREGEQIT